MTVNNSIFSYCEVRPRHFLIYKHSRRGVCVVLSSVPKYSLREDLRSPRDKHSRRGVCVVLSSVPKYSLREDLRFPRDVYHCLLVQKGILHSSLSQSLRAERRDFLFICYCVSFFTLYLRTSTQTFFLCLAVLALNSLSFLFFL